jgi:hypothetical protein
VARVADSSLRAAPAVPAARPGAAARLAAALAIIVAVCCAPASPSVAAGAPRPGGPRGGGESQIDESSPDDAAPGAGRVNGAATLPERLREYVEGSLARYDALKSQSAGFRRQGWFPSLYLREPARDVVVEPGASGALTVTVHIASARRDLEQRLVIGPAGRFELPGADKRFFAELLGALATASPEVGRVRLNFWFATLQVDGQMTWELRGGVSLSAAAAGRFPAGARTAEAIWPLLEDNTLSAAVWDDR